MLGLFLQGRGQGQDLVVRGVIEGQDIGHLGAAPGEGAGLVEDHGGEAVGPLQGFTARIRMPSSAPRPEPTITAVGVASPMAQGQAMMRTATMFTRERVRAGAGPKSNQPRKVRAGDP